MPETPREDSVLTPRTRVRRLSIGVANFVRQLSEVDGHNAGGSLTHRGVEQNFYREPIGVKDKPPTDAEVLICLGVILSYCVHSFAPHFQQLALQLCRNMGGALCITADMTIQKDIQCPVL